MVIFYLKCRRRRARGDHESTQGREQFMKSFNSHWERVRLAVTPSNLRIGLFIVSVAALVVGGTAGEQWSG